MEITLEQLDKIKIHFIVARPRTGSTLLATMLNQNKMILSTIEEPFAYFLYPKYHKIKKWTSKTINDYCTDFFLFSNGKLFFQFGKEEDLKNALEQFKEELNYDRVIRLSYLCFFPTKDKSQITTIIDKQLKMGNYLLRASKIFPNSNFLFLYRNPLDNLARRRNQKQMRTKNAVGIYSIIIEWFYYYKMILTKKNKINSNRSIEVKYEDLIDDAEKELKKICSYFGLKYETEMLDYTDSKVIHKDTATESNTKDISIDEFLKLHEGLTKKPDKSKIGAWKSSLSSDEIDIIWSICGVLAKEMGYNKDDRINGNHIKTIFYFHFIEFLVAHRLIIKIWYLLPFSIQRLIKIKRNDTK